LEEVFIGGQLSFYYSAGLRIDSQAQR
jgi:hypothetical protein